METFRKMVQSQFVDLLRHSGVKVVIKSGNGEHGWRRERVGAGTGAVLESGTGAVLESSVAFEELVQTLRRLLIETPSTESEVWSRPKPQTEVLEDVFCNPLPDR
jgi:hypothetical protein